jgi:glycosyltransferase involved in cell wall biosynthesis
VSAAIPPEERSCSRRRPLRVVLSYRVLQHWRVPVFRRLAQRPNISFLALHGADFPGTKVVNGRDLSGIDHRQLATLRVSLRRGGNDAHFPFCPSLPFHLLRHHPDVILAEGGSNLLNNFLVFAYALPTRTPVVWWTLGELRQEGPLSRVQRAFRALYRWMERRSAVFLGYSSLALRYFARQGYPSERCYRAVNCVDTDLVLSGIEGVRRDVPELRRRHGLEGCCVILFVGALIPAKRIEDLIAAYARVRPRHPDLRLVIVGDGPHRTALEAFAVAEEAEDVVFTGQVIDRVGAWFELSDLFVLPGLGGLAISEAMAHGLPVIATEADGCEVDLVEEGENGFLLPTGDRDTLADRLDELAGDRERLAAMGRHSRWIIENRFNIHTYMENVVAALECAARSGSPHRCSMGRSRRGSA